MTGGAPGARHNVTHADTIATDEQAAAHWRAPAGEVDTPVARQFEEKQVLTLGTPKAEVIPQLHDVPGRRAAADRPQPSVAWFVD